MQPPVISSYVGIRISWTSSSAETCFLSRAATSFLTAYSGDASFGKVEAVAPKPAPKPVVYTKPAPKPVVAFKPAPPAPKAATNNDDLVAKIISQLTPFIKPRKLKA